jgi:HEPN domain-containing protein
MNAATEEWVSKADGDYGSIRREIGSLQDHNYDAACYHAQQAVEKYLKAWLQEQNVRFPRIHELLPLLNMCAQVDSDFRTLRRSLKLLDDFELRFRYPGDDATLADAESGLNAATQIRDFVRARLGL